MNDLQTELLQQRVEPLRHGFRVNRRDLLKSFGLGLLVCAVSDAAALQESGAATRNPEQERMPRDVASWIHIDEGGRITVFTGKTEVGQNIRTSLAQQVAEELRVPVESVTLVMADTQLTPFDAGTFGSRTTPQMGTILRGVAASARAALLNVAAERMNTDTAKLSAADGAIHDSGGRSLKYAELLQGKQIVTTVAAEPPITSPAEWKVAGQPHPKLGGADFVTGKHQYTSDMSLPGMLHARVVRPSAFNATLASLDASEAQNIPGVKVVHDGDFVAVASADSASAQRARQAIKTEWKAPPQMSEAQLYAFLRGGTGSSEPHAASERERGNREERGSVDTALASADKRIEATYTVAYIQHAPLEPRAAVAEWKGEKLTVWTGSQRPFGVRQELMSAFHLPEENVRVIVPDTGSGYGGKHTGEAAVEAARIAKATGTPVKLVWTREEEFTWAYFRPAGVMDVRAGARSDGTLVAWEFHNYNSGPSAIQPPYDVPNQRVQFHPVEKPPLRQGSYRCLAGTANHFARESAMDELSHALAMDPLEFRLKNISDPRLRAVFETAARKFGWGKEKPTPERGFGLAGGLEKGGYIATMAEVAIDPRSRAVRIARVVQAWDCGPIVNPNGLRNQVEGGMIMGIGGALFEDMHFENGRVTNPRFAFYRVPRFRDMPKIEVELIDRKDAKPFGAGETPIVGIAPAVGNAIFNATGIRLRSLPLVPQGLPEVKS